MNGIFFDFNVIISRSRNALEKWSDDADYPLDPFGAVPVAQTLDKRHR